eukprot:591455-Rhodomonas_salina.2
MATERLMLGDDLTISYRIHRDKPLPDGKEAQVRWSCQCSEIIMPVLLGTSLAVMDMMGLTQHAGGRRSQGYIALFEADEVQVSAAPLCQMLGTEAG